MSQDIELQREKGSSILSGMDLTSGNGGSMDGNGVNHVEDFYESWFLEYASYVILDRAVPNIEDGLKPVQRRILHSMDELEDGRYNKAANVIGNTMKYHPHGDMAISDAMVKIAQKDLLIDMQGNWGNTVTGDSAAASRYIEARLSKFALDVLYSDEVTEWSLSYDGRNKEPVSFPVKFPLLQMGAEGIAVGLSTKILPHNFNEIIDASIKILNGKKATIYPDFPTGGKADFSKYNQGKKGGKVKVRAAIDIIDNETLKIKEIPATTTTGSLIDSIISANDKGKIKIKRIEDNTAQDVEVIIKLNAGVSPHLMIDALYAFTDCEVSISPNCCVIKDDKPIFCGVDEVLAYSTERTKNILLQELENKKSKILEKLHMASLESIFIGEKIYQKIEKCETWEDVLLTIRKGLKPFEKDFIRALTEQDIEKLTEIKIKRISKFDRNHAEEAMAKLNATLKEVKHNIANIVEFAIAYFTNLKEKHGKGRERKTKKETFGEVKAKVISVPNQKLYVNKKDGFIGTSLKKEEFAFDCSERDEIIVFRKDGKCVVTKVSDKSFVGKNILHLAIFTRGDAECVYHLIYQDGKTGPSYVKRFSIPSVTRDREYDLTRGTAGSKVLHFSVNPKSEGETVEVSIKPSPRKVKPVLIDFSELDVKTRSVKGNLVTKKLVNKVKVLSREAPKVEAQKIWFDSKSQRLNTEEKGIFLGSFVEGDNIYTIYKDGSFEISKCSLDNYFSKGISHIGKLDDAVTVTCIYYHGEKKDYYVKRFKMDESLIARKESYVDQSKGTKIVLVTLQKDPAIEVTYKPGKKSTPAPEKIDLVEYIAVKGYKALGNKLSPKHKIKALKML